VTSLRGCSGTCWRLRTQRPAGKGRHCLSIHSNPTACSFCCPHAYSSARTHHDEVNGATGTLGNDLADRVCVIVVVL